MEIGSRPDNFIINMSHTNCGKIVSNFVLHGLRLKNDSNENLTLKSIIFELYASDALAKKIVYDGEALNYIVKDLATNHTYLGKGFSAKLYLGTEDFWHPESYTASVEMEPMQETGVFNEYFLVIYDKIIDKLVAKVNYVQDEEHYTESLVIPVVQYKNKNSYILPLKGSISTCGNYNTLPEHRQHYSMEFAFDMAQYNIDQKLCYKENMRDEDYVVYGKDVLAIADGEVVDCYSTFDMTTSWVWEERKPYLIKYGLAAQCGNYIVLKHENGEYSFYGHFQKDSLTVKKGDMVKQGQVIAKIGSTGLSGCPHLHFQLMDGPDFMTARGLPCAFTNIKDVCGDKLDFIMEENIIVHAE